MAMGLQGKVKMLLIVMEGFQPKPFTVGKESQSPS